MSIAAPPVPFKGLAPFEASDIDALLFFGRGRERDLIVANLLASRLTVLYGPSGVGKSSLLQAGVAHRLRGEVRADDRPDYAVVVFNTWTQDPIATLRAAVRAEFERLFGPVADQGRPLAVELSRWASEHDVDLLLLLDQVEEYFVYHGQEDGPVTFPGELPELVAEHASRTSVLLAIRDDSLARLDRFKARIPNLFANYLRLDHLDRDAARTAILGPIDRYNRLASEAVEVEAGLADRVLDQTEAGRVDLGERGRGDAHAASGRIEAPYLQLVMRRLWEEEQAAGSTTLRVATLERIGGANEIVRSHLQRALDDLDPREKDLAATVFRHLVTPSGTKIAHAVGDLAEYANVDERELRPVVSKLVDDRILRPLAPREAARNGVPHEIYHDVLGEAVLAWRRGHETQRRVDAEGAAARRRHRRALAVIGVSLGALAVMTAIAIYALVQRGEARKLAARDEKLAARLETRAQVLRGRELVAKTYSSLAADPQASLGFASEAAAVDPGAAAEDALRKALIASRLRRVIRLGGKTLEPSFSPNGRRVLAGSTNGKAVVFDAGSGRVLRRFGFPTGLTAAAWSPTQTDVILIGGRNGTAELRRPSNGALLARLRHGPAIRRAVFSPDGSLAVTAGGPVVRVWNVRDRSLVQTMRQDVHVRDASIRHDNRFVVTAGTDSLIRVFDVGSGTIFVNFDNGGPVTSANFSPRGALVIGAGQMNGDVRIWAMRSGTLLRRLSEHETTVLSAVADPRGVLIGTASKDGKARVWKLVSGTPLSTLSGHESYVTGVVFDSRPPSVLTMSADRTARVWRPLDGTQRAVLAGHTAPVTGAAFTPTSSRGRKRVVTSSEDGTVRVWDPQTDPRLSQVGPRRGAIQQVADSPDGRHLAVASRAGALLVRARNGTLERRVSRRPATATAFSPDGSRVAFASGRVILVHDVRSGRNRSFGLSARVNSVDFSRGDVLAASLADGTVRIWDGERRRPRTIRVGKRSLSSAHFGPAGARIVTAGAEGVPRVFDVRTRKPLAVLRGASGALNSARFSPDGRRIVAVGVDGELRVWRASGGNPRFSRLRHFGSILDAEYSPDGRWIVTAGPTAAGVWQASGELEFVFFLIGPRERMTSAIFGPGSRRIITASVDGTIRSYTCDVCGRLPELRALARARLAAAQG